MAWFWLSYPLSDERAKNDVGRRNIEGRNGMEKNSEMQIAWKAAKSAPDIRRDKVEPIKKRLLEGRYEIDADRVAEKICDSLF
jgi:flagellar biosynthesis anti-sigma factor FlgM